MIALRYNGDENKAVRLLIHAGIIKNWTIENEVLLLSFEKIITVKEKPTIMPWGFQKELSKIKNKEEVLNFLRALTGITPDHNKSNQPKLF